MKMDIIIVESFKDLDILTSMSILIAVFTFLVSHRSKNNSDRRRNTLDFLFSVMKDQGNICQANLQFASWILEGKVFENDNIDKNDDMTIIQLIDFYDLISDAAMENIIDKKMIILHLGGRMRSAHKIVEKYISARRNRLNRYNLYKPFETFVINHIKDSEV